LRASEVRKAVLGENIECHETTNGFLTHYKVFQVKDANYPLIKFTNNEEDVVQGLLIYNISLDELNKLDKFEGINYFRQYVKINVAGKLYDSQIYIPDKNLLHSEPWDYEIWYNNDMQSFFNNEFDLNGVKEIKN
jgi:gamma-glutamylcyclotransferase (GGCT)/AIG2-like uncharacterized protein YtfP